MTSAQTPLILTDRHVHFVGIGGCGMSGLANIARAAGAIVTGSDRAPSATTDALQAAGVPVVFEQTARSVPADCDMLVISAAIPPEHPEFQAALSRGIEVLKYAQLLGRMMRGRTGVAIAGTHGKSTTTAMLAHTMIRCELDPSFIVGANCEQIGGGSRVGRDDLLIAEACEYDRSFHNFHPTHAVVLNVEEDHLDIYGSLDGVVEAFNGFVKRIAPDGSLLIGHESACRTAVAAGARCDVETIGFAPEADYAIRLIDGRCSIHHAGEEVCAFAAPLPGEHMAFNAAAAAVTAHRLGAPWAAVGEALASFRGLDRRMQTLGEARGVLIVDDYGHHPTEIRTTLRALRQHHLGKSAGRLLCVFQPHQHSRTRFLLEQFAASFDDADIVIVPHIYFVRDSEADRRAVSAADLVARLTERNVEAMHIDAFNAIVDWLAEHTRPGDLLVVMGAGPVGQVAHELYQRGEKPR